MQKKPQVLFVYSTSSATPFVEAVHRRGFDAVLLHEKIKPQHKKLFDRTMVVEGKNFNSLKKTVLSLKKDAPIVGVVSWLESAQYQAACIRKMLGLPGPSPESALVSHDKYLMRKRFAQKKIAQPQFALVATEPEALRAAKKIGFPIILKPLSGSKSFLVQKIENVSELAEKFRETKELLISTEKRGFDSLANDPYRHAKSPDPRKYLLIEEALSGRQFAVTSIVQGKTLKHIAITDLVTTNDLGRGGFNLVARTTPSRLSTDEQKKIMKLAAKCAAALKITDSPIHPEILLTARGPKIIEVASRIGGYRAEMTNLAFGIDLADAVIALAVGEKPQLKKKFDRASTCVEVFPEVTGKVREVTGVEEAQKSHFVVSYKEKRGVGDAVSDIIGERTVGAIFFTVAKTPKAAERHAFATLKKIHYRVDL